MLAHSSAAGPVNLGMDSMFTGSSLAKKSEITILQLEASLVQINTRQEVDSGTPDQLFVADWF